MDWVDFVNLMKYMVDTYGVPFGYGDESHEGQFPEFIGDCESAWFECPECGEPVLYCDWAENFENDYQHWGSDQMIYCPICEAEWNADQFEEE